MFPPKSALISLKSYGRPLAFGPLAPGKSAGVAALFSSKFAFYMIQMVES